MALAIELRLAKHILTKLSLAVFCLLTLLTPAESDATLGVFSIIVHPQNKLSRVSDATARKIYMGQQTLWPSGATIAPAMGPRKSRSVVLFLKSVVRRSPRQYGAYWKKRLFSGGGIPPRTFDNHEAAVRYVAEHVHSLAVVTPDAVDDSVKALNLED